MEKESPTFHSSFILSLSLSISRSGMKFFGWFRANAELFSEVLKDFTNIWTCSHFFQAVCVEFLKCNVFGNAKYERKLNSFCWKCAGFKSVQWYIF